MYIYMHTLYIYIYIYIYIYVYVYIYAYIYILQETCQQCHGTGWDRDSDHVCIGHPPCRNHVTKCQRRIVDSEPSLWHDLLAADRRQVCCRVLKWVAVCCSVTQCVAVWCSVLQYTAVWCSVVHCCCSVVVCCTVWHCAAESCSGFLVA